jgi:predicted  nucleic acid-binding Zn-ribbon protein
MAEDDVRVLERRLGEWTDRIRALESQFDEVDPRVRQAYRDEIQALWDRRHTAEERLAHMRREEAQSWEKRDLQSGILRIFDEIGERLDRVLSRI